jgi:hypothetical protein
MSKHNDERERERSARKQAEIDAEVNNNKEIVYNYIASHKDVSGKQCVEELGFFEKGKRYLEWLSLHGHLVRMKRTIDGKRMYVYNAIKPYVKPETDIPDVTDKADVEAQIAIKRVTRVFNLLDRPQEPKTKEDRERLRRSTRSVAIGSSMNMFRSW